MFSVAPNIVFAPNMTQNAERKHRTQDTNTANFRSYLDRGGGGARPKFYYVDPPLYLIIIKRKKIKKVKLKENLFMGNLGFL